jgi:hypothetical protein
MIWSHCGFQGVPPSATFFTSIGVGGAVLADCTCEDVAIPYKIGRLTINEDVFSAEILTFSPRVVIDSSTFPPSHDCSDLSSDHKDHAGSTRGWLNFPERWLVDLTRPSSSHLTSASSSFACGTVLNSRVGFPKSPNPSTRSPGPNSCSLEEGSASAGLLAQSESGAAPGCDRGGWGALAGCGKTRIVCPIIISSVISLDTLYIVGGESQPAR